MEITLNNGLRMPIVGLGVWPMEGKLIREVIIQAINLGYRVQSKKRIARNRVLSRAHN
ncbi:hypothetical protein Tsubulata_004873 [Turnera subulata]|uniref:NADP-dependent oxidoreductase domain-containing protein n=1 Tax=Turnera subulata TaxID=218843 RepID=A0A9Q0GGT0_9ROSI|nr:hypothetical protein Tsubulata_004873 [Turnera subulata]